MNIEKIVQSLNKAQNDSEKFALLLVLSEIFKKEQLDFAGDNEAKKRFHCDLFNSINPHFLARLIATKSVPEGCSKLIYKSVSLSILIQFSEYDELIGDPLLISKLDCLYEVIEHFDFNQAADAANATEDAKQEFHLIDNIMKYLYALSAFCAHHLCKTGLLDILMRKLMLVNGVQTSYEVMSEGLFMRMIRFDMEHDLECKSELGDALKRIISTLDKDESELKFRLIKLMSELIAQNLLSRYLEEDHELGEFFKETMLKQFKALFKSKLNRYFKMALFDLLDNFLSIYPELRPVYLFDKELLYLLIYLVSIEIRMPLEDAQVDVLTDGDLIRALISKFNLFERFFIYLETGDEINYDTDAERIANSIKVFTEVVETLMDYLNDVLASREKFLSFSEKQCLFVVASIRLIACWFSYEELKEDLYFKALKNILEFSDFYSNKYSGDASFVNVYQFIVPSLRRFIDNNKDVVEQIKEKENSDEPLQDIDDVTELFEIASNSLKRCESNIQKMAV